MKKIRILFTIPNFDTAGSGKHMVDLIRNLDADVFEPSICCDHKRGGYFAHVEKLGYPIYLRRLAPDRSSYLSALKTAWSNARFFKQQRFDIIHSFHWKSDWFEPLAARFARIPWVYTKKNMVWNKHWTLRTKGAKFVFTLNPEMIDVFPIPKHKSACVGLGPNVDEVISRCKGYDKELLKQEFGVTGKFVVLSIANLVEVKNIDLLVRAFARLKNRDDLHLFVVGDKNTAYGEAVVDIVKQKGLEGSVTLTGKVMDVEKYISMADLYVQPSHSEASGVACMEACATALPAIGSNVAGLRFVIDDPQLLFEPDSEDALLETFQRMVLVAPSELSEIGKLLQRRMYDLFHMPNVAKEHEAVYRRVVFGNKA